MPRHIPGDWYEGGIPDNAVVHENAYLETAAAFESFRSRRDLGFEMGEGSSAYHGTIFDVGESGLLRIGRYTMLNSMVITCDEQIEIGDHCLISWNVVIIDSYRVPTDIEGRRAALRAASADPRHRLDARVPGRAIRIGNNVWIGFDTCILPGVTIGDGSVIGARSVVRDDIPANVIAGGNPARVLRPLSPEELNRV